MQRPGHRKRRGRTTLSNHPSGGAVLNWSPLHTRQWADNKCILRFVALFSIPNSGLGSLVRLADGQPGPPSVLTPNSGSRNPALSTCSRILDSATASSRTQSWEDYRSGETQKAVQHCSVSSPGPCLICAVAPHERRCEITHSALRRDAHFGRRLSAAGRRPSSPQYTCAADVYRR